MFGEFIIINWFNIILGCSGFCIDAIRGFGTPQSVLTERSKFPGEMQLLEHFESKGTYLEEKFWISALSVSMPLLSFHEIQEFHRLT